MDKIKECFNCKYSCLYGEYIKCLKEDEWVDEEYLCDKWEDKNGQN